MTDWLTAYFSYKMASGLIGILLLLLGTVFLFAFSFIVDKYEAWQRKRSDKAIKELEDKVDGKAKRRDA